MSKSVYVTRDEWYPVYTLNVKEKGEGGYWGGVKEIDDATYRRIKRVFDKFEEVQEELAKLMGDRKS